MFRAFADTFCPPDAPASTRSLSECSHPRQGMQRFSGKVTTDVFPTSLGLAAGLKGTIVKGPLQTHRLPKPRPRVERNRVGRSSCHRKARSKGAKSWRTTWAQSRDISSKKTDFKVTGKNKKCMSVEGACKESGGRTLGQSCRSPTPH